MRRFIEIMWLVISAVSLIEMVVGYRADGLKSEHLHIFGLVFVASTFMYFFRKRQRRVIEKRKNSQE